MSVSPNNLDNNFPTHDAFLSQSRGFIFCTALFIKKNIHEHVKVEEVPLF